MIFCIMTPHSLAGAYQYCGQIYLMPPYTSTYIWKCRPAVFPKHWCLPTRWQHFCLKKKNLYCCKNLISSHHPHSLQGNRTLLWSPKQLEDNITKFMNPSAPASVNCTVVNSSHHCHLYNIVCECTLMQQKFKTPLCWAEVVIQNPGSLKSWVCDMLVAGGLEMWWIPIITATKLHGNSSHKPNSMTSLKQCSKSVSVLKS